MSAIDQSKINASPRSRRKTNDGESSSLISNEIDQTDEFKDKKDKFGSKEGLGGKRYNSQFFEIKTKDFLVLFCFSLSVYLYVLSLEGCHETQTSCLVNLSPQFFHRITYYLLTCSFINSFILFLTLKRKLQMLHIIYSAVTFSYLTLIYDVGGDLAYHGSYNRIIFYLLVLVITGLIFFMNLILNLLKRKFFKLIIFMILSSVLFIFLFSYKLSNSCNEWEKGLNNVWINNDESFNKCKIVKPKNCWVEIMDGLLDVSWLLNEDCNKFRTGEKEELMKYLNSRYHNSNKFAYPITTKYKWINDSKFPDFFPAVLDNLVDLEKTDVDANGDKPEVSLTFHPKTKLGKIDIQVHKNETLIKERKELIKTEDQAPISNNILFIYVDSISRPHFIRKMKKTSAWIEKYIKNNNDNDPHESTASHTAYQFMKYHAFIFFTQLNINPMFYGQSMYNKNGTHLIKHLKQNGFITGQSNNICERELYDIEDGYIENVEWSSFDHENVAMMCDPNFSNPENPYTPYMGPYSIKKRCLYGRNTFEYVLEYGEKFWETYLNERKFLRVAFQDAHEGTGEAVRYLDDELILFLEKFERNGWLNDTTIFFVSDHGNNMIGFYNIYSCEDFVLEKTLASLFMLTPKNKLTKEMHQNLKHNEQIMVTPYDIHNTMLNILNMGETNDFYSKMGKSFFSKISGLERDCKTYKQDMSDLWCRCR
jgi:hypothetical protein